MHFLSLINERGRLLRTLPAARMASMQNVELGTPGVRAEPSTAELVREALNDGRRLIQLEVALAKDEVRRELVAARSGAITLGVSAVLAIVGVALLLVGLALAIFPGPVPALIIGVLLLVGAAVAAALGLKLLPKKPLDGTRKRLETDIEVIKDQVQREHA
jgi:hypothetical protein